MVQQDNSRHNEGGGLSVAEKEWASRLESPGRIELFGGMRLLWNGQEIAWSRTHKSAYLLAYLALHLGQEQAREQLIERFWPGLEPAAGRDNLSTALSALRRQLAPYGLDTSLHADRQWVRLDPAGLQVDAVEFLQTLRAAERAGEEEPRRALLEQAIALYRGDLLPGYYEEWALQEQERLRERCLDALRALLALQARQEAWETVRETADRAIALDPYDETFYRARMRACAALGRPAAAKETFQALTERLRQDFDVAPSTETRTLAARIRSSALSDRTAAPETYSSREPIPVSASAVIASLPLPWTRLFGRKAETAYLTALLAPEGEAGAAAVHQNARLVTLTGPGGVGKTRLSLAVAQRLLPAFESRVWFVPLADIPHPRLLLSAIAHTLQLRRNTRADLLEQIVAALGAVSCLLVLDNFEHLLQPETPADTKEALQTGREGALIVRLLLERIPHLVCLVGSRRRLGLSGEREFPVAPLPLPPEIEPPEQLRQVPSVALYLDRAQALRPDFALTAQNAEAIAVLCRKLEGMPLALEMAAAWVHTIPPARMLEQMERQLDLLVSRHQDIPPRHRSLRAAIAWSYNLLTPELQTLFKRLAVFRGWTLEAAEAVCAENGAVLDLLAQLQEQSLILMEDREVGARYRMLETLREYAREQLFSAERVELQNRHAAYYRQYLSEMRQKTEGATLQALPEGRRSLDKIDQELDNLRAALSWSFEGGELRTGMALAIDLDWFWMVRGYRQERREWAERALVLSQGADLPEEVLGAIARNALWYESAETRKAYHQTMVARLRRGKDRIALARELIFLAEAEDFPQDIPLLEESVALGQQAGNEDMAHLAMAYLAGSYTAHGRFDHSLPLLQQCLEYALKRDQPWHAAKIRLAIGEIAGTQGRLPEAVRCLEQALTTYRQFEDRPHIRRSTLGLSVALGMQGKIAEARVLLEDLVARAYETDDLEGYLLGQEQLATLALRSGDLAQAQQLLEQLLREAEWRGDEDRLLRMTIGQVQLALCRSLDRAAWEQSERLLRQVRAAGAHLYLAEVTSLHALAALRVGKREAAAQSLLESLTLARRTALQPLLWRDLLIAAEIALAQGQPNAAAQWLEAAAQLRDRIGLTPWPFERAEQERFTPETHASLPEAAAEPAPSLQTSDTLTEAVKTTLRYLTHADQD